MEKATYPAARILSIRAPSVTTASVVVKHAHQLPPEQQDANHQEHRARKRGLERVPLPLPYAVQLLRAVVLRGEGVAAAPKVKLGIIMNPSTRITAVYMLRPSPHGIHQRLHEDRCTEKIACVAPTGSPSLKILRTTSG
jgi:hypothetical protein